MREQGNYHRPFGIGCSQGELLSLGGVITWCVEYEKVHDVNAEYLPVEERYIQNKKG